MSVYRDATFSVNQYDKDGDLVDDCIMVYVGTAILRFTTVKQLDVFVEQLQKISSEIKENY